MCIRDRYVYWYHYDVVGNEHALLWSCLPLPAIFPRVHCLLWRNRTSSKFVLILGALRRTWVLLKFILFTESLWKQQEGQGLTREWTDKHKLIRKPRLITCVLCFCRICTISVRHRSTFLGGGFCCSVFSSRRYIPPALLASLKYACSPCVLYYFFVLSCVADVDLSWFFSSLYSLFRVRFGHRLFSSCLFLVGTMLSPRFRFLLRLV